MCNLGFKTSEPPLFLYNALFLKILNFTYRDFPSFHIAYFHDDIAICKSRHVNSYPDCLLGCCMPFLVEFLGSV